MFGQGRGHRLRDRVGLPPAGRLVGQVQDAAGTQEIPDELQFGVSRPDPEQVDVDREDLVELLAAERPPDQVDIGQVEMVKDGFPRGDAVGVAPGGALDMVTEAAEAGRRRS